MLLFFTFTTRVLAVTWVHSSTGVKLPIAAIAELGWYFAERIRAPSKTDGMYGWLDV